MAELISKLHELYLRTHREEEIKKFFSEFFGYRCHHQDAESQQEETRVEAVKERARILTVRFPVA